MCGTGRTKAADCCQSATTSGVDADEISRCFQEPDATHAHHLGRRRQSPPPPAAATATAGSPGALRHRRGGLRFRSCDGRVDRPCAADVGSSARHRHDSSRHDRALLHTGGAEAPATACLPPTACLDTSVSPVSSARRELGGGWRGGDTRANKLREQAHIAHGADRPNPTTACGRTHLPL